MATRPTYASCTPAPRQQMTQPLNLFEVAAAQGEGAYIDCQAIEANPYPKGSPLAQAWHQGYEEMAEKDIFKG